MKIKLNGRRTLNFFKTYFKKPEIVHLLLFDLNNPVIVELSKKPKTRAEVAEEYNVSVKVLNGWFFEKKLSIPSRLICPADLRIIYATLGPPGIKTQRAGSR